MNKKFYIVLDCESCPMDRSIEGVDPRNMLAYDLGFAVVDRRGNVYETRSYIISDIYDNEPEKMQSAYYADKLPKYEQELAQGKREKVRFYEARRELYRLVEKYNVQDIFAHNMRFDFGTLNNTAYYLSNGKYKRFFTYATNICDTLKMARQLIATMPTYKNYCIENGYLTKNNQPRLTAEILYRFISTDNDFTEAHTGLEDVLIEKEILRYMLAKHKKVDKELWSK